MESEVGAGNVTGSSQIPGKIVLTPTYRSCFPAIVRTRFVVFSPSKRVNLNEMKGVYNIRIVI